MRKHQSKNGFTLAELLIVVAIIAVLVAVAIPVFSAQLEKSRDATSIANIRSAYAEAQAKTLEKGNIYDGQGNKKQVIDVSNVRIESKNSDTDWNGMASNLPFKAPSDPGESGLYTITFGTVSGRAEINPSAVPILSKQPGKGTNSFKPYNGN